MCGRFTQMMTWSELHDLLGGRVTNRVEPETIYNAAPTMAVLTALPDADVYVLATMVWGVEPEWASSTLINAQAERYTASGRNFWAQFKRCLIPASGFYEWKKVEGGPKQPMYIRNADGAPFMFAGLYAPDEQGKDRCVIVTTRPNELMEPIHNRMPAILLREHYKRWLDPEIPHTATADMLAPYSAERMRAYPVSRRVNDVKNQSADLVKPISRS